MSLCQKYCAKYPALRWHSVIEWLLKRIKNKAFLFKLKLSSSLHVPNICAGLCRNRLTKSGQRNGRLGFRSLPSSSINYWHHINYRKSQCKMNRSWIRLHCSSKTVLGTCWWVIRPPKFKLGFYQIRPFFEFKVLLLLTTCLLSKVDRYMFEFYIAVSRQALFCCWARVVRLL